MDNKEKLEKLLAAQEERRDRLTKSIVASQSEDERKAMNETREKVEAEIAELRSVIDNLDEPAPAAAPLSTLDLRKMTTVGMMKMRNGETEATRNADPYATEEYRSAFMDYVLRGTPIPAEYRKDETTKTADASAVIPTTMLHEIVKELKVHGNLFSKVRKLNVQGGVTVPILSVKPTAKWITADTATSESDKQKVEAKTSVTFNYYGLECKISQTLLTNVTTIDAFQELFVSLAVEAIAQALDVAIMNGTGSGEPQGITTDSRVPAKNKVTLNPTDFISWSAWKKKVFGKMGKAYRDGIFVMAQGTFDGYIDGMVDSNGQPIGRVNYGIDGAETYRFGGKSVETVEDDVLKSYDDASDDDVVAVFFKPTDYAINSNLQMQIVKWVDNNTNEINNKAILIADGKLIDANGVILVKKGAAV